MPFNDFLNYLSEMVSGATENARQVDPLTAAAKGTPQPSAQTRRQIADGPWADPGIQGLGSALGQFGQTIGQGIGLLPYQNQTPAGPLASGSVGSGAPAEQTAQAQAQAAAAAAAGAQGAAAQGGRAGTTDPTRNSPQLPAEQAGGAPAQGAAAASANARPGTFNPSAAGKPQVTPEMRNGKLFDYGDPTFAMQNALRNMGVNPLRQNPFIADFMKAAPGLAMAHIIQNAGSNAEDVAGMGGAGTMFGGFLQDVLGRGAISSTLGDARGRLGTQGGGGVLGQLTSYLDSLDQGGAAVNPFLNLLYEQLDNPNEAAGLMTSLMAPSLGSDTLASSYGRGQKARMGGAYQNYLRTMTDPNTDWWRTVMGQ